MSVCLFSHFEIIGQLSSVIIFLIFYRCFVYTILSFGHNIISEYNVITLSVFCLVFIAVWWCQYNLSIALGWNKTLTYFITTNFYSIIIFFIYQSFIYVAKISLKTAPCFKQNVFIRRFEIFYVRSTLSSIF